MRTRSRTSLALSVALGLVASLALGGVVLAAQTTLTADLAGDAETAEDGTGSATITLDPATGELCWDLMAEGIGPVLQSHIHVGAAGESGDVVVPLDVDGFEDASEGCNEPMEDAQVLQDIVDDPAGYYVNLHTEEFPGGAIRGQLAAAPPNTAVPTTDRSAVILGLLVLALATAIALRTWHPLGARD
ncbi:MAG TPA: CHRD domain-containing protein [Candidatus Limnocylindria bacterium]